MISCPKLNILITRVKGRFNSKESLNGIYIFFLLTLFCVRTVAQFRSMTRGEGLVRNKEGRGQGASLYFIPNIRTVLCCTGLPLSLITTRDPPHTCRGSLCEDRGTLNLSWTEIKFGKSACQTSTRIFGNLFHHKRSIIPVHLFLGQTEINLSFRQN